MPARPIGCPHRGAELRNRAVHWHLRQLVRPELDASCELLDVGGSRLAVELLCREHVIGNARYRIIDLRELRFHAQIRPPHRFMRMDVTRTDFTDESFDILPCNHTRPYVHNDCRALANILPCLKTDELAMLDSSHDSERTCSAAEFRRTHPDLGDDHFAKNGDQWVYGQGYLFRIESPEFQVRVDHLFDGWEAELKQQHGLKSHHELVVAFNSSQESRRFPPPKVASEEDFDG